ncbi:hypothetical protein P154DRAFT_561548 [Amniculicola lignicola CBS 123094]|uniref:Uncharacterized protein n=1 Tax=Amniculicola lignicola CBS 123094 TaxID=1392246 RepID=A0A6A5WNF8_9PLEO|nr:hypothetical protein P154DRAFT_561548 [Amniculicola lignicola CBS 123094]
MHAMAHWRLENGERMRVLDQLLGSTGLFATVVTQLKFRNMGVLGFALILLWALSPVGGQASLRILDYDTATTIRSRTLYFLDRNSTYQRSDATLLGSDGHNAEFVAQSLFAAALGSTKDTQEGSMDSWGNLKIPMIERISSLQDLAGWHSIDHSSNISYSSLLGIPISTVSSDYNTTFNLETWYWTLDCPRLVQFTDESDESPVLPGEESISNSSLLARKDYSSHGTKREDRVEYVVGSSHAWALTAVNFKTFKYETDSNIKNRMFYYRGQDDDRGGSSNGTRAECQMSTTYVEVEAKCLAKRCSVDRMRLSKQPHPPKEHAMGIDPSNTFFAMDLHDAMNPNTFRLPTPFQRYFVEPYAAYTRLNASLDLYKLPKREFSLKMAQLMNTYWQGSISLGEITSGIPPDDQVLRNERFMTELRSKPQETPGIPSDHNTTFLVQPPNPIAVPTYESINATESQTFPVLKCQRSWLAALFVATSAMFLSGVFGLVLECTRKAPDFALNLSSLTRDNPYIRLPPGGSTLDSIDRTRLLRNVRIRLGDVKPDDPVGYVAIASYDRGEKVERLRGMDRTRTFT